MAHNLESIEAWRALSPLSIAETQQLQPHSALMPVDNRRLSIEGYCGMGQLCSEEERQQLVDLFTKLHQMKLPMVFAFVYDLLWEKLFTVGLSIAASIEDELVALPAFWAWYVDPQKGAAGWPPHRDRGNHALDSNGKVLCYNSWFALTDATPDNGCMYVLPKDLDEHYGISQTADCELQSIRALTTTAGQGWVWDQGIYHWGGRATPFAQHPRLSCALEFQLASAPTMGAPLLQLDRIPSYPQRLHLIMSQLLQYKKLANAKKKLLAYADYYVRNNPQSYGH